MSSSGSNSTAETPPSSPADSSPPAPPSSDNGSSSSPPPQSSPPTDKVSDSLPPSPSPPSGSSPPSSSPSPPSGSSPPSNNSFSSPSPSTPSGLTFSAPTPPDNGRKNNAPSPQSPSSGSGNSPPALGSKMSHSVDEDPLPAVIAISAGGALLFACLVALLVCCLRKQKKKSEVNTYMTTGPPGKVNDSGYNRASPKRPHGDHFLNMPPPPGAAKQRWQAHAANGAPYWQAQPSPPALPIQSSDLSSSNFSAAYGPPMPPPPPSLELGFNKSTFTYEELLAATGGFAQDNILGQGGFGYVHKGVLPNGKEIAVKSLKATSGQGDREFQAEIDIISRVHHRHLVSLVGYCISGERKLLVYEFVPNKTLEYHLYEKGTPVMDWPTRLKIAMGAAKGLAYLHEDCHPRIIHRDIKAANILLEYNFDAKVADFGLAKLNQDNHTHVSTRVMGTFGYLAPEYASSGKLTDKSDVFSFGMMLLELITGRPPVDVTGQFEDSLVDWARPLCIRAMETGDYDELVDPRLENNYNKHEMSCMVACASASIRHSARRRPKMSQIIRALEGDISLNNLNEGVKPGQSSVFSTGTNSDYDASSYSADMRKFRKLALSEDEVSSEYAQTSDFGSNPSFNSGNDSAEMSKRRRQEKFNL